MTSEQERVRTMEGLRALYEQATNEAHMLFRENAGDAQNMLAEAKERFNDIVSSVKQMATDMQRELDTTRSELRRGILELPQETAESAAQMRRVIVDQIEALAELNRIVARHGRGMDAQSAEPARRAQPEESVVVSMGGRVPRPVARGDITGAPAPAPMQAPPMPPRRRVRAAAARGGSPAQPAAGSRQRHGSRPMGPPPAGPGRGGPGGGAGGGAGSGWLTDLLSRASREDGPPSRPDERQRPTTARVPTSARAWTTGCR